MKTLADVFTKELIVGASAPGSATWDFPFLTNALLGTKFKIVTGYRGATEVKLAMERGEVEANAALAWGSAKASYGDWLRDKKLRVVAQYGAQKAHDLPDVPLMPEAKAEADRQTLDILYARSEYGRPFFLPPGVPAERATALRRAFAATMQDSGLPRRCAEGRSRRRSRLRRGPRGADQQAPVDPGRCRRSCAQAARGGRAQKMSGATRRLRTKIARVRASPLFSSPRWPWAATGVESLRQIAPSRETGTCSANAGRRSFNDASRSRKRPSGGAHNQPASTHCSERRYPAEIEDCGLLPELSATEETVCPPRTDRTASCLNSSVYRARTISIMPNPSKSDPERSASRDVLQGQGHCGLVKSNDGAKLATAGFCVSLGTWLLAISSTSGCTKATRLKL